MHINHFNFIIGAQWGDEGKGKISDKLISDCVEKFGSDNVVVVGINGGSNAGHTVNIDGVLHHVHYFTTGALHKNVTCYMASGKVIEPISLQSEYNDLKKYFNDIAERTFISDKTHITTIGHLVVDGGAVGTNIGTTRKGIGPTYSTQASRTGIRICDVIDKSDDEIRQKLKHLYDSIGLNNYDSTTILYRYNDNDITRDKLYTFDYDLDNIKWMLQTFKFVNDMYFKQNLDFNKYYVCELSNGSMLNLRKGTYPNVTSSDTTMNGVMSSLNLNIHDIRKIYDNMNIIGVVKSYVTRVGSGSMVTRIKDDEEHISDMIVTNGKEFGVTTGRKRRPGWLDLFQLKYSCLINGITKLNITRLDNLNGCDTVKLCIGYKYNDIQLSEFPETEDVLNNCEPVYTELSGWKDFDFKQVSCYNDLHDNVKKYLRFIESYLDVKVGFLNTGQERNEFIYI